MKTTFTAFLLFFHSAAFAAAVDIRQCNDFTRDANGNLTRSAAVLRDFQKIHPCPATGLPTGACPGWSKDHVIPRADGGCDAVFNLQWLPNSIKTCADPHCKDRFERKINATPLVVVP
jgi:hypothetical protein